MQLLLSKIKYYGGDKMSKNGKLLFRNYDPYVTSPYGYRTHPITKIYTKHDGVDYGTYDKKLPTYAIEDGSVVRTGYTNTNGNFVYVTYPRLNKNAIYQHLDSISVKNGQKVDSNTIIGYTGKTGSATGIHLHFGFFPTSDQNKDWYSKNWINFEEYDYPELTKQVGTPVSRDTNNKQIEVKVNELRARNAPNGEILGYINLGIYNIIDSETNYGYTWYKTHENYWIAYNKDWEVLYEKEVKEDMSDDKDNNQDIDEPKKDLENEEETKKNDDCKKKIWYRVIDFLLDVFKKVLSIFKIK